MIETYFGVFCENVEFVGNKAKGRISKRVFQKKQSMLNFPKNEHFFSPDTHVSEGKKYSFFRKFGVLCFLETPVLRCALLPIYRRVMESNNVNAKV